MYRVLCAYLKQQYSSLTAYKSAFCMTLVNVFIRIYAYAMLWMTLYKQNASLFGNIDLNQMLLYSITGIYLVGWSTYLCGRKYKKWKNYM